MRVQTAALLLAASTAYGFAPATVRAPVSLHHISVYGIKVDVVA